MATVTRVMAERRAGPAVIDRFPLTGVPGSPPDGAGGKTVAARTDHDVVELVALDETTWRVCDPKYADGGARSILGYLSDVGDRYEMMWMRPRAGVTQLYPTYEAAIEGIIVRLHSMR